MESHKTLSLPNNQLNNIEPWTETAQPRYIQTPDARGNPLQILSTETSKYSWNPREQEKKAIITWTAARSPRTPASRLRGAPQNVQEQDLLSSQTPNAGGRANQEKLESFASTRGPRQLESDAEGGFLWSRAARASG